MVKAKTGQKFAKSVNVKSRSGLNTDGSFDPYFSSCMHDPSFIALVPVVLEKITQTQKLNKGLRHLHVC